MTMTQQESLALVRQLLGAKDDDELTQIIGLNLGRIDGTFFGVLNASVTPTGARGQAQHCRGAAGRRRPHVAHEDADLRRECVNA